MPGKVKQYIESIDTGEWKGKQIGVIVQSGFRELGISFLESGRLDGTIAGKLRKPWKMGLIRRLIFSLVSITGLTNFYRDHNLKTNGAFEDRFAAPYKAGGTGD